MGLGGIVYYDEPEGELRAEPPGSEFVSSSEQSDEFGESVMELGDEFEVEGVHSAPLPANIAATLPRNVVDNLNARQSMRPPAQRVPVNKSIARKSIAARKNLQARSKSQKGGKNVLKADSSLEAPFSDASHALSGSIGLKSNALGLVSKSKDKKKRIGPGGAHAADYGEKEEEAPAMTAEKMARIMEQPHWGFTHAVFSPRVVTTTRFIKL